MPENWYVLCVAILRSDINVEQAFQLYKEGKTLRTIITKADEEDMVKLKDTCSYAEIGYMYGLTSHAAYRRIKEHKKRAAEAAN